MGQTKRKAAKLARSLEEEDMGIVGEKLAISENRGRGPKRHVAEGFKRVGWEESEGILYNPNILRGNIERLLGKLRNSGLFLVSSAKIMERLSGQISEIDSVDRGPGTELHPMRGESKETILDESEVMGWEYDESRDVLYLPLEEIADESLITYHVLNSFR